MNRTKEALNAIKTIMVAALLLTMPIIQQVHAQQPQPGYAFQSNVGLAPVLNANIAGTPGSTTAYYVLVANFVGGSIPSNIITLNNVPNTLDSSNFVSFIWQPVSGVVTYDLLKLSSAALPVGSNNVLLHGALSLSTTQSTDQGSSLTSYTIAAPPLNLTGLLVLDSRDFATPQFDFLASLGNIRAGLALNDYVLLSSPVTTTTATGGVTITAAQLVNGLFTHNPTSSINDTTDTATAIVAALPSCIVSTGGTASSAFNFWVFNTSSGANTITVVGGTNVTIVGTATVAQNAVRSFRGVVTACTGTPAVSLYSLGSGAF